jgi:eukaryotic-like serine/threonine-protein kinase
MAEVLLGRVNGPSGFERVVVLKRILPHLAQQTSFVQMFLDEARIIARIHHPNVVNVHELGSANGELFMVMEYLAGESTSSLLRRLVSRNEPLPPRIAAFIVAEACAGLHAAHELRDENQTPLNVVHRDVSPQNVFITYDGAVKVIDFGIAKAADRIARTEAGDVKGKLDYMAPEQCKNEPLDRRTDIFALGIVLYELLARRRLFRRSSPAATVKAVMRDFVVPPSRVNPDCPPSLDAICMRALDRDRDKRYPTALDMRRELMAAVGKLGGDRLPEEELAGLMRRALEDRRQLKDVMLARIREGSNPTEMPSPEAEAHLEIPVVDAMQDTGVSVMDHPRARRARWSILAAVVVAVVGLVVVVERLRASPPVAQPAAQSLVSLSVMHDPPLPSSVHVSLESDPAGATIVVDGLPMGTTPATLTFALGAERRKLVLQKIGYVEDREDFAPDVDQKLRFPLKPAPRAVATSNPPIRKVVDDQPTKW